MTFISFNPHLRRDILLSHLQSQESQSGLEQLWSQGPFLPSYFLSVSPGPLSLSKVVVQKQIVKSKSPSPEYPRENFRKKNKLILSEIVHPFAIFCITPPLSTHRSLWCTLSISCFFRCLGDGSILAYKIYLILFFTAVWPSIVWMCCDSYVLWFIWPVDGLVVSFLSFPIITTPCWIPWHTLLWYVYHFAG